MIENPECYQIGNCHIPLELIDILSDDFWSDNKNLPITFDKNAFGETTRVLYFSDFNEKFDIKFPTDLPDNIKNIKKHVVDISNEIVKSLLPNYTILKIELLGLKPRKSQNGSTSKTSGHRDKRVLHRLCRRIHIPCITNDGAFLVVNSNQYHLPVGSVWVFDNISNLHYSKNYGKDIRWHIVADVIDSNRFNEALSVITNEEFFVFWEDWVDDTLNFPKITKLRLEKEQQLTTNQWQK